MQDRNILVIKAGAFTDEPFPTVDAVGKHYYFKFGQYGSSYAQLIQVLGEYATYQFPDTFNLKEIKELIYNETRKKAFSIRSL